MRGGKELVKQYHTPTMPIYNRAHSLAMCAQGRAPTRALGLEQAPSLLVGLVGRERVVRQRGLPAGLQVHRAAVLSLILSERAGDDLDRRRIPRSNRAACSSITPCTVRPASLEVLFRRSIGPMYLQPVLLSRPAVSEGCCKILSCSNS